MASLKGLLAKIPRPRINPHVLGAGALTGVLVAGFLAVMVFGKPGAAEGGRIMPMPSAISASTSSGQEDNHGEDPAIVLANTTAEPSLPGIRDLDQGNPVPRAKHNHSTARTIPVKANPNALAPVPVKALTTPGPGGPLPVIGPKGRRPGDVYARPFKAVPNRPSIAVVIGGLGLKKTTTLEAINTLPPQITLSFVPYTRHLQDWVDRARAAGHEVMIELPMEPFDYPQNDPGPQTLLASVSAAENTRRLEWLLSRATGYFAVTNYMGSRFTASELALAPVLRQLRQRGVDFIYDGETRRSSLRNVASAERLRWTVADRIVDTEPSAAAIDEQFLHLEALAIQNGTALGVGFSWPVTMKRLKTWTATLSEKGYVLAPASAVLHARNGAARLATASTAPRQIAANTGE